MQPFTSLGLLWNQAKHLHREKHHITFTYTRKKVSWRGLLVLTSSSWVQWALSKLTAQKACYSSKVVKKKPPPASSLSGPRRHNSLMASCFTEALRSYAKLMNWETNRYRQKSKGRRPLLKVKWNKLQQQGLACSPSMALHTVYFAQMEMECCLGCNILWHLWLTHVITIRTVFNASKSVNHYLGAKYWTIFSNGAPFLISADCNLWHFKYK